MLETILHSRWEHGAREIKDLGGRYEIEDFDGTLLVLQSKRQLLMHLYRGRDLHIPFDRYFKLGKYSLVPQIGEPSFDLFPVIRVTEGEIVVQEPSIQAKNVPKKSGGYGLQITESDLNQIGDPPLGIDLAKRGHEVAKLMYKGFGAEIGRSGYDHQDVLQEIYRGILSRNNGKCPFDVRKSSFSHYVYMVCRCVIRNIHRAEARRRNRERIGISTLRTTGEPWADIDVASCDSVMTEAGLGVEDDWDAIEDFRRWVRCQPRGRTYEGRLACEILPHIYQGLTIKEIAALKELPPYRISRAIRYLKSLRSAWYN